ncbi:hypothetical protein AB1Y20_008887 [Prymnesium parvum]|uniref:Uncharacterized protein n=1 Tax=Prymnesium parvum TaxID=97485 RepID=A0AB34ITM4_PRYPA
MAADAAGADEAAVADESSRWISVDGSPPAPCQPNSLAWSADNLLAVAAGGGVVVLDPTLPSVRHSVPLTAWGLPLSSAVPRLRAPLLAV